jgi:hypothetical protein
VTAAGAPPVVAARPAREDGAVVVTSIGVRWRWLGPIVLASLAGCGGGGAGAGSAADAGSDRPRPPAGGLPPCVPGIRETACAGSGVMSTGAGGAGRVDGKPGQLVLLATQGTLSVPLHPELARWCAREQALVFMNTGGEPIAIAGIVWDFVQSKDECSLQVLPPSVTCTVRVCFSGGEGPGQHLGTVALSFRSQSGANAGTVTVPLTANVLPPTPGLSPTFGSNGAVYVPTIATGGGIAGATLLDDATVAARQAGAPVLTFVTLDGKVSTYDATPDGGHEFQALAAGAPGQGFHALLLNTGGALQLLHFSDDRARDPVFGSGGALSLGSGRGMAPPQMVARPSGGVVLVNLPGSTAIRAVTSDGQLDPTFTAPLRGAVSATTIDSRGRIYVATGPGIVRLAPDGSADPTFAFTGTPQAMTLDLDEQLLVALTPLNLVRLDEAGAGTPIALATGGTVPIVPNVDDLDVDARGRILVTGGGFVLRYAADGTPDGQVGFSDGGARAVMCPLTGGACLIAGTFDPDSSLQESFVVRLLP